MSLLSQAALTVVSARAFTNSSTGAVAGAANAAAAPSYTQRGQLVHPPQSMVYAISYPAFSYDGSTMVLPNILAGGVLQLLVYTQQADKTYTVTSVLPVATTNVNANDCTAAISYDGTVCAVSSQYDGIQSNGLVVVFRRVNGAWVQIFSDSGQVGDYLGFSLTMSADGATIAAGAMREVGAFVNVYYRNGNSVVRRQRIGQPANAVNNGSFGFSCALSGNGQTLAVGAPNSGPGFVAVYARSSRDGSWSAVPTVLVPAGVSNIYTTPSIGTSVSLDYLGVTLAVGCFTAGVQQAADTGCVVVYTTTTTAAGEWAQGQTIIPYDIQTLPNPSHIGHDVSLSADGNTLSFDGYGDNGLQGGVWIFSRGALGLWAANGVKRAGTGYTISSGESQQRGGQMSPDASVLAIVSDHYNDATEFAFWIFA